MATHPAVESYSYRNKKSTFLKNCMQNKSCGHNCENSQSSDYPKDPRGALIPKLWESEKKKQYLYYL